MLEVLALGVMFAAMAIVALVLWRFIALFE